MYENTPNHKDIDSFIAELHEIYRVEKLKNWEYTEFKGEKWEIRRKFLHFTRKYPPQESIFQGEFRAFVRDNPHDTTRALTVEEREWLNLVKGDLIANVKQARGIKKDERRTFWVAITENLANLIPKRIWP